MFTGQVARSLVARSLDARSLVARSLVARSLDARSLVARSLDAHSLVARSLDARSLVARSLDARLLVARRSLVARSVVALWLHELGLQCSLVRLVCLYWILVPIKNAWLLNIILSIHYA